jgi:catechol 2,3-dioxygenase-like lactoylglutathione lyase family enzyme
MTITSLDHGGFTVADLDRSVQWYTELLGSGPVVRRRTDDDYIGELVGYPGCEMDYAYFQVPGGESKIELIQYLSPESATVDVETTNIGSGHVCLVVDDLHGEFERLREVAVFRSAAPVAITAGPNEGGWVAYLRDPDGITIELLQRPRPR